MDVSFNIIDNKHHVLMYSLNGNFIDSGEHKLFDSSTSFKLDKVILGNSNNKSISVNIVENITPSTFSLKQNYPNPFNPTTSIEFDLEKYDYVKLVIYDINGRHIATLADNYFSNGTHKFIWNSLDDYGSKVSSGVYIYRLISSDNILTKKMLLLK